MSDAKVPAEMSIYYVLAKACVDRLESTCTELTMKALSNYMFKKVLSCVVFQ